ncbi:MAG: amino acid permease [Lewinellaceae bacterium]|nr:amino acid permease [Lewinellaceae bacterium]
MSAKLHRDLGLLEVSCISAGVMISSGLFILPALAYAKAGPGMVISYLISSLIIIPSLLSISELVTAMPRTGGIYYFTDRSMGPIMGTLGGLIAWIALAFKSAFSLLAIGLFMVLFYPGIESWQVNLIATACCLFFCVLNILGVKVAGRAQVGIVLLLLIFLIVYIVVGCSAIEASRFRPFAPGGVQPIIASAGLIFVAYAGTTKIAAIAGEVKDPGRNLPLGMLFSWGIVSILYVLATVVTVGLLDGAELAGTVVPISLGGKAALGGLGLAMMSIAALLAFVSTGNAGLLAASRNIAAMGRDGLVPGLFFHISQRRIPWFSVLFTTAFMVASIWFLGLEDFAKTASALQLLLFIFANLAVIFMREANMQHYRPRFRSPLYPWVQGLGILLYAMLLTQMGAVPLLLVGAFVLCALAWYFGFTRRQIKREYALIYILEQITGIQSTDQMLEEELREILIERDDITRERFQHILERCPILDLQKPMAATGLAEFAAGELAAGLKMRPAKLYRAFMRRYGNTEAVFEAGVAFLSLELPGRNKFGMMMIRDKQGIAFSRDHPPAQAAVITLHSHDLWAFNFHALAWVVEMAEQPGFHEQWQEARDEVELREVVLEGMAEDSVGSISVRQ